MELEPWWPAGREARRAAFIFLGRGPEFRPGVPPVRVLRAVMLGFAAALVVLVLPLVVITAGVDAEAGTLGLWVTVAGIGAGVGGYAVVWRLWTARVAVAASTEAVLDEYRKRFFLLAAMAEMPALVSFIAVFLVSSLLPYLVVLPLSLGLLAHGSPRVGDVQAVQEAIHARGGSVNLAAALMTPPSPESGAEERR